jgi:hypothetical protein
MLFSIKWDVRVMIKEAGSGSGGSGVGYFKILEYASGGCTNTLTLVRKHARQVTTKQNLPTFLTNKTVSLQFVMTVDESRLAYLLNSLQCQSQNGLAYLLNSLQCQSQNGLAHLLNSLQRQSQNGLAYLLNYLQCQSQNSETAMIIYIMQTIYLQKKPYKKSTFQNMHLD